jgi:hypothetical protein
MSFTVTHEFLLADTEDELMEVTVEKDGSIRLMWWEEALLRAGGGKSEMGKKMCNLPIQRADFEKIAATIEYWDDAPIRKGLSNE